MRLAGGDPGLVERKLLRPNQHVDVAGPVSDLPAQSTDVGRDPDRALVVQLRGVLGGPLLLILGRTASPASI